MRPDPLLNHYLEMRGRGKFVLDKIRRMLSCRAAVVGAADFNLLPFKDIFILILFGNLVKCSLLHL